MNRIGNAVELEADVIYRFDLEGAWTWAGTLTDPYLRGIYDSAGNLIPGTAVNHGGLEWNSRLAFAPSEDGTYYVAAGAAGSRTGTYKLTVTSDTHAAGTNTTGQVSVGGSVSGDIDWIWDRDWFAVTLQADIFYRIDLKAARNGVGTLYDPKLYGIHDSNGNLIAGTTDDNSGVGLESRGYFTPSADGTYYVSAGSESPNLYGDPVTGTYTLSVTNISAADAQTVGTETSGRVAVGGFVRGEVHYPGDRDWFAVELDAGIRTYLHRPGGFCHTGAGSLVGTRICAGSTIRGRQPPRRHDERRRREIVEQPVDLHVVGSRHLLRVRRFLRPAPARTINPTTRAPTS